LFLLYSTRLILYLVPMQFFMDIPEEQLRRERQKARELRRSQWWRNRIATGLCHYCGGRFAPAELTLDHVVPLVRGGLSSKGNCVAACKDCNTRKRDMLPTEWQDYLDRLT
jgi:5-methylcytosine-specific restriction protein A